MQDEHSILWRPFPLEAAVAPQVVPCCASEASALLLQLLLSLEQMASSARVYVGNLPLDVQERELDDLFYKVRVDWAG